MNILDMTFGDAYVGAKFTPMNAPWMMDEGTIFTFHITIPNV